jgi:peptidoglycan/LPS O-acetylase OafA/YrhL
MTPAFSIYLDLVRVTAAVLVLLYHASFDRFGGAWLQPAFARAGSPGVMIFFVLSGFVIAWVTATRERSFQVYIVNRLARLWSVAIPALIMTAVVDAIGRTAYPEIYPSFYLTSRPLERLGMAAAFVNEIWFLSVQPLSNSPFWSLCYEWWYYVVFGCFTLIRGAAGWGLGIVALAIMGPKILLLFPIWLLGVAAFRHIEAGRQLPTAVGVAMFLAPLGIIGIFALEDALDHATALQALIAESRLGYSSLVISGTLLGVLVAMNLFSFPAMERHLAPMLFRIETPVRWIAGATLSIYLFHFPLLHCFGALLGMTPNSPVCMSAALIVVTMGSCLALSTVTEGKKAAVRRWLEWLVGRTLGLRQTFSALGKVP